MVRSYETNQRVYRGDYIMAVIDVTRDWHALNQLCETHAPGITRQLNEIKERIVNLQTRTDSGPSGKGPEPSGTAPGQTATPD